MDPIAEAELVANYLSTRLFDEAWYRARYLDVGVAGIDPLLHFVRFGIAERRQPNPYFDGDWYLANNTDVANLNLDPLVHYARHGDAEGRRPHPLFDAAWYRKAHELPADQHALLHFLAERHTGRYAPCPELFPVPFLTPYRDDPALGVDPFEHYINDMAAQGRECFPDYDILRESGLIDENYYLINATDVHEAELDPVVHYCRFGWWENRRPNIYFEIGWYRQTNPDLVRLNINPLVHDILVGEPHNRRPVVYFDPGWYRSTYDVPANQTCLAHFLSRRRSQTVSPTPLFDVAWYVAQNREELGTTRDPFAHYLQAGTIRDLNPSADFDAVAYRRTHLGRPSRAFAHIMRPDEHNPLVHRLRAEYQ